MFFQNAGKKGFNPPKCINMRILLLIMLFLCTVCVPAQESRLTTNREYRFENAKVLYGIMKHHIDDATLTDIAKRKCKPFEFIFKTDSCGIVKKVLTTSRSVNRNWKDTNKAIIKDIKRNNIRFYVFFETHRVPDDSTILKDAKKRKYYKVLVTVPDSYQKYFIKGDDSGEYRGDSNRP